MIREDPDREGLLYAGTEWGMFVSFDDGATWQDFQLNLPVTPITDIKVVQKDLAISTMGRSFWILDDLTPLHEATTELSTRSAHMFQVRDAYRRRGGGFGGFGGGAPHDPQYAPIGAAIDYYFSAAPSGEVRLEILNEQGELVREFTSEGPPQTTETRPTMRDFETITLGAARLPTSAGAHRFYWNLQHAGPWDANPQRSGQRGPVVVPGRYQARLSVGDWSETRWFGVNMDPRVTEAGVSYREVVEQVTLALETRDALSEAKLAALQVNQAIDARRGGDDAQESLREIQDILVTAPRRYSRPKLVDQLQYLYGNMLTADQEPGVDAQERYVQLRAVLDDAQRRLDRLLRSVTDRQ